MATAASGRYGPYAAGGGVVPTTRRAPSRESYLQASRSDDHLDASCQVDISHEVISYDSDTEMGRRRTELTRNKRGTPVYSKEDIREQYCINEKEVHVLERLTSRSILNCFSERNPSPCKKQNLLTSCYKRKRKSDCPEDSARPLPRPQRTWQGSERDYDDDFFRRRPRVFCYTDPKRYTWTEGDVARGRLRPHSPPESGWPPSAAGGPLAARDGMLTGPGVPRHADGRRRNGSAEDRLVLTQPSSPDLSSARWRHASHDQGLDDRHQKHVSFEQHIFRSQTMSSIDDTVNGGHPSQVSLPGRTLNRSQERLLDGRRTPDYMEESCNLFGPFLTKALLQEKMKRSSMRTQSTQTDLNSTAEPAPPSYLSLSPRTVHKRLRSQEAPPPPRARSHRPLTKSHSEVGERPGPALRRRSPPPAELSRAVSSPITTPDSPRSPPPPLPLSLPPPPSPPAQDRSPTTQEIIIDYKPCERPFPLQKTLSEGEMLSERRGKERTAAADVDLARGGAPRQSVIDKLTVSESDLLEPSGGRLWAHEQMQRSAAELPPPPPPRDYDDDEFHENLIENLLCEAVPQAEPMSSDSEAGEVGHEPGSPPRSTLTLTRDSLSESQETVLHVAGDTPLPLPSDSEASTPAALVPPPPPPPPPPEPESGSDCDSPAGGGTGGTDNGARSSASGSVPSLAREEALVLKQLDAISTELDHRLASPEELSRLSPPPPPPPPPPLEGWKDASPAPSQVSSVSEGDEDRKLDKFMRTLNDGFESDVTITAEKRSKRSPLGRSAAPSGSSSAESSQRRPSASQSGGTVTGDAAADGIRPPSRVESLSSASSIVGSEASWRRGEASDGSGVSDSTRRQPSVKRYSRYFEEDAAGQLVEVDTPGSLASSSPDKRAGGSEHRANSLTRRQLSKQFSVDEPERAGRALSLQLSSGGRSRRRGEDSTAGSRRDAPSDLQEETGESAADDVSSRAERSKTDERWTKRGVGVTSGMVRSPAMHDGFRAADWSIVRTPQTPDKPRPGVEAAAEQNGATETPRKREKKHKKRSKERTVNGSREDSGSRSRERTSSRRHTKHRSPKRRSTASEPCAPAPAAPETTVSARPPASSSTDLRPEAGGGLAAESVRSVGRAVSPGSDSVFAADCSPERTGALRTARLDAVSRCPSERAQCASCGERLRTPEADRSRSASGGDGRPAPSGEQDAQTERPAAEAGSGTRKDASVRTSEIKQAGQATEVNGAVVRPSEAVGTEPLAVTADQKQATAPVQDGLAESSTAEHSAKHRKREKRRQASTSEQPPANNRTETATEVSPLPATEVAASGAAGGTAPQEPAAGGKQPSQPLSKLSAVDASTSVRQQPRGSSRRRRSGRPDRGASEERVLEPPPRPTADSCRARSEERCGDDWRQLQPSPRASQDSLSRPTDAATQCTISARDLPDEESGLYKGHFPAARWLYIGTDEELRVWRRAPRQATLSEEPTASTPLARCPSTESTESEREFRRRYQAISHRMVHRKSSGHMFTHSAGGTFAGDKTVMMQKCSGEFGFRIHGSRPVVVSAIEPGTPAQLSGLQVGDIIVSINGSRVLDSSHGDVVRIAHAASDQLQLEVASTGSVLPVPADWSCRRQGWLWRRSGPAGVAPSGTAADWRRRWAVLQPDALLFLYKRAEDVHPVLGLSLADCSVTAGSDCGREMAFTVRGAGSEPVALAAETESERDDWLEALRSAAEEAAAEGGRWQLEARRFAAGPPDLIPAPDCCGFLIRLGFKWRDWTRLYCVLKDGVLYFYRSDGDTAAFGSVYLHGYRVQSSSVGGGRRPSFEVCPPVSRLRHYYFIADSDNDRKRWLAALEYSIDRWIKVVT
ncbi:serine/arginine repetitive matrix protein 2-like isoform X2 [Amphibalanus amphitrite]|uniref:serine/arginine repetitive matrix protein 2-like isoform X2 n=1 Tax=Amphibalanus amphitrite TaxID=1232801 RepID=UPI001C91C8A3|nr:serine/arginine repetitive matrix protein 2-like isoform X2 [Amphibalanus amphitrite]